MIRSQKQCVSLLTPINGKCESFINAPNSLCDFHKNDRSLDILKWQGTNCKIRVSWRPCVSQEIWNEKRSKKTEFQLTTIIQWGERQLSGCVRILENLESPGILFWHFPGLGSPGKRLQVLESHGNLLNSCDKVSDIYLRNVTYVIRYKRYVRYIYVTCVEHEENWFWHFVNGRV